MTNKTDVMKFDRYIIMHNGSMFDVVEVVDYGYIVKKRCYILEDAQNCLTSLMYEVTADELKIKYEEALANLRDYLNNWKIQSIDKKFYQNLVDCVAQADFNYSEHVSTY